MRPMRARPLLLALLLPLAGCAFVCPPDAAREDAPAPPSACAAPVGSFLAGAAAVDVTPPVGTWLGGFGVLRDASAVHDPIWARALAVRRDGVTAVVVAVDVVGLHHHVLERCRARLADVATPEAVLIAATHTHSGPDTMGLWGLPPIISGIDDDYLARLEDGIVAAGRAAVAALAPATLRVGQVDAPEVGISKNRRQPDLIDRTVTTLAFDGARGPLATLVHFGCHPEALGSDNDVISSDFPWALRRTVEAARPAPCVFLNGALGGMVTTAERDHTFSEVERIGVALGRLALGSLEPAPLRVAEADLEAAVVPLWMPVQNRRYHLGDAFGLFADRPFDDGHTRTAVQALRLGPVVLVTAPGEPLPRVALELQALVAAPVRLVVGLGADELGYLIDERDWTDDRYDYERTVSPGPLAVPLIRAAAARALAGVHAGCATSSCEPDPGTATAASPR